MPSDSEREQRGPGSNGHCGRCWLSVIHAILSIIAGFYIIWIVLKRQNDLSCLSASPQYQGVSKQTGAELVVCDIVLYTSAVTLGWGLLSILLVNCCWWRSCVFNLQIILWVTMSFIFVTGGAVITTNFVIWCDQIMERAIVSQPKNCLKAATALSNSTLIDVYWNSTVQQACVWSLSPLAVLLTVSYAAARWMCRDPVSVPRSTTINAPLVDPMESTPLLPERGSLIQDAKQDAIAPQSQNPFGEYESP